MSKVWLIARHQYRDEVFKRGFLIALLSLPLFLGVSIGAGYLAASLEDETTRLGYVDDVRLLLRMPGRPEDYDVQVTPFETAADARAALADGTIDAFYVLPADYADTGRGELVYRKPPPWDARQYFRDALRLNLLADRPQDVQERAIAGPQVTFRAAEIDRQYPGGGPSAGNIVPLIVAVVFVFVILSTSGLMMQAVVREKENRTMEIILTSTSAGQMMNGKIIGIVGIALTQLLVWVACLVAAVWAGAHVLNIAWLQDVNPIRSDLLKLAAVSIPSFLFITAVMTTIGSTMVETQDAQQLGGLLYLFLFLPFYLILPITQNPNGGIAITLSLLPITSVMTNAMRMVLWDIPVSQIAASAAVSLASGALMVWVAGKALRIGMLRYGKRIKLRELFGAGAS